MHKIKIFCAAHYNYFA